jgi:hypothetical protein
MRNCSASRSPRFASRFGPWHSGQFLQLGSGQHFFFVHNVQLICHEEA